MRDSVISLNSATTAIVNALANPNHAEQPRRFPSDRQTASLPGMYSWWSDENGLAILSAVFGTRLPPLLYVGQAGATSWPSGKKSKTTIGSRVRLHIRARVQESTFRATLAAVLREPLSLTLIAPRLLDAQSESRLTAWIADNLCVAICAYPDRDSLESIERAVLLELDPPLNLENVPVTPIRSHLTSLRSLIYRGL